MGIFNSRPSGDSSNAIGNNGQKTTSTHTTNTPTVQNTPTEPATTSTPTLPTTQADSTPTSPTVDNNPTSPTSTTDTSPATTPSSGSQQSAPNAGGGQTTSADAHAVAFPSSPNPASITNAGPGTALAIGPNTTSLSSSSSSSSSSTGNDSLDASSSNNPHTAGIIAGVLVPLFLILLCGTAFLAYRRRQRSKDKREWQRTHEQIAAAVGGNGEVGTPPIGNWVRFGDGATPETPAYASADAEMAYAYNAYPDEKTGFH